MPNNYFKKLYIYIKDLFKKAIINKSELKIKVISRLKYIEQKKDLY